MFGSPIDPSFSYAAVTPSDTAPIKYNGTAACAKAFYVGGTGNLVLQDEQTGASVTFLDVLPGVVYPFSANKVMAATTATNIVALF